MKRQTIRNVGRRADLRPRTAPGIATEVDRGQRDVSVGNPNAMMFDPDATATYCWLSKL
jgi:hypothetical protein